MLFFKCLQQNAAEIVYRKNCHNSVSCGIICTMKQRLQREAEVSEYILYKEDIIMSCFNFGGNNCCWIIILILLFCVCGNNGSDNACGNNCGNSCNPCC